MKLKDWLANAKSRIDSLDAELIAVKALDFSDRTDLILYSEDEFEFDKAEEIFYRYCGLINYFDDSVHVQFSFENQTTNPDEINKKLDIPLKGDRFDDIRKEYSDYLKNQAFKGRKGKKVVCQ